MTARYTVSALTEHSSALLLRLIACLVRHRIEIEAVTWVDAAHGPLHELRLVVRSDADHVRRAVKQMGACVGVVEIDYRLRDD